MRLRLKFNLVLIVVFAIGFVAAGLISHRLLQENAREEVLKSAGLIMESALSVRKYTVEQIRPRLEQLPADVFHPQTVPAYAATEVFEELRKKLVDYSYKEATLNPTNPRDRAVGWEVDVVNQFRGNAELKEVIGQRDTPGGPSLFLAKPLRITNPACLQCHSSVEAAPKTMIDKYGPANGFGWNFNEVVGAQVISVPLALPLQRAEKSFNVFIGSLIGVFVVVGIVLNLMIWLVVVRPVTRLSELADRVSQGDLNAPDFPAGGGDEIGVLAQSFSRMRTSVVQAMKMLES